VWSIQWGLHELYYWSYLLLQPSLFVLEILDQYKVWILLLVSLEGDTYVLPCGPGPIGRMPSACFEA